MQGLGASSGLLTSREPMGDSGGAPDGGIGARRSRLTSKHASSGGANKKSSNERPLFKGFLKVFEKSLNSP